MLCPKTGQVGLVCNPILPSPRVPEREYEIHKPKNLIFGFPKEKEKSLLGVSLYTKHSRKKRGPGLSPQPRVSVSLCHTPLHCQRNFALSRPALVRESVFKKLESDVRIWSFKKILEEEKDTST